MLYVVLFIVAQKYQKCTIAHIIQTYHESSDATERIQRIISEQLHVPSTAFVYKFLAGVSVCACCIPRVSCVRVFGRQGRGGAAAAAAAAVRQQCSLCRVLLVPSEGSRALRSVSVSLSGCRRPSRRAHFYTCIYSGVVAAAATPDQVYTASSCHVVSRRAPATWAGRPALCASHNHPRAAHRRPVVSRIETHLAVLLCTEMGNISSSPQAGARPLAPNSPAARRSRYMALHSLYFVRSPFNTSHWYVFYPSTCERTVCVLCRNVFGGDITWHIIVCNLNRL